MHQGNHCANGKLELESKGDIQHHQTKSQQHGQPALLAQFIAHLGADKFDTAQLYRAAIHFLQSGKKLCTLLIRVTLGQADHYILITAKTDYNGPGIPSTTQGRTNFIKVSTLAVMHLDRVPSMKTINFMGQRKLALLLSTILILVSIGSLATRQLEWGLDFTGGTLVEVHYSESANLDEIRTTLGSRGYAGAIVVSFGSDKDVMIRLPKGYSDQQGTELLATLQEVYSGAVELRRIEFVGPQVGDELREQGGLAMLLALGLVMLYIAFRFQFKFAVGAVVALVHDVVITLGFFSVLGLEFDLTVLAAILAVIGYSLNDTIVVSDRIRENFRKLRRSDPEEVVNISLTETLGRTLVTSLTTLMVLLALAVFGGEIIHGFAIALIVGVAIGTYSSIYVAANVLLMMGVSKEDLMIPLKEGVEQDELVP